VQKLVERHDLRIAEFPAEQFEGPPSRYVWEVFGEANGAATYEEMLARITGLRAPEARRVAGSIGCNLLDDLFFLDRAAWVTPPDDWPSSAQSGKWYDTSTIPGRLLWDRVQDARSSLAEHAIAEPRYGNPVQVLPRLGQRGFRLLVTDAYQRRCAITGERTLPVFDAAHIKPYAASGPHALRNGLLLRKDLHALFDAGS
jgi:putative restriction endonuclease